MNTKHAAGPPGTNERAGATGVATGSKDQHQRLNSAPGHPAAQADQRFRYLRDRLSERGHRLLRTSDIDGDVEFVIVWRGLTKVLRSLAQVEGFLVQIGGAK